ncbi:MAG TPA: M56 family metallopeptidase [Puia sp.]|nr:M56 family metallopeptidase [Puia sp.]
MIHFIPDTILRAVCWTLLHSLWQGLIVALIAGLIMVLTKKSSSSLRYTILCGLLFLFLGVSGYTFYHQLPTAASPAVTTVTSGLTAVASPSRNVAAPTAGAAGVAGVAVQSGIESLIQYFDTHAALVVLVWFIIFLGRFVQMLSGLVYAQRIRHYQTSDAPTQWNERLQDLLDKLRIIRPVLLLESTLIKSPVVIGFLKPVILVPLGMLTHLAPDQVESILLHELAHIRRQDYLLNVVQNLVDTLFFFNPAMIWISSLIRTERENCCDDIAIRETRSRRRLIEALVSFHEYEQTAAGYALSFAAKENQVVRRVKRIVHKKNHSLNAGERVLLTTGLLILSAAFVTINNSRADAPTKKPRTFVIPAPVTSVILAPVTPKQAVAPTPAKPAPSQVQYQPVAKPVQAPIQDTTPKTTKSADLFQNASVDKLIEARDHGVTAEFVSALQQMGYRDLTLDKAIELRDHGVDAEFIENIRALGFTHFSLDDAVRLKDHGVSADYIGGMKKRFGKLFEINDYIKLMDAGISPTTFGQ